MGSSVLKGSRSTKEVEDFAARIFNARKKRQRAHHESTRRTSGQLMQHEDESKHDTVGDPEHAEESKHDTDTVGTKIVDDEDLALLEAMEMEDSDNEDSSDGSGIDADIA